MHSDSPDRISPYRLYYNPDTGRPTFMSGPDGPAGNYISITKEEYDAGVLGNMRVERGKLVIRDNTKLNLQLKPSTSGYPVVKNHPVLILESYSEYTDEIEYYDRNS